MPIDTEYRLQSAVATDGGQRHGCSFGRQLALGTASSCASYRYAVEGDAAAGEGGRCEYAFSFRFATVAAVLSLLDSGDHVVMIGGQESAKYDLPRHNGNCNEGLLLSYSGQTTFEAATRPETKTIWLEASINSLLNSVDLVTIAAAARKLKLLMMVDNDSASLALWRPLEHGAGIVVYSDAKYINGDSNLAGTVAVVGNDKGWPIGFPPCITLTVQ